MTTNGDRLQVEVKSCKAAIGQRIPHTAVGGSFKSSLHTEHGPAPPNPTHGSGWIDSLHGL